MSDSYNFTKLKTAILARSEAKDWEIARKEWSLIGVFNADEPETCLCGHFPIVEVCQIKNRITKCETEVGNVCVKRFLGFRSDLIFSALKRIERDVAKSLNADAITFFYEHKILNDWEYGFLQDIMRKRDLSDRQISTRAKINKKVLAAVKHRGFKGPN